MAVGEQASTSSDTIVSSVLSAITDESGPTIASTSSLEQFLDRVACGCDRVALVDGHEPNRSTERAARRR